MKNIFSILLLVIFSQLSAQNNFDGLSNTEINKLAITVNSLPKLHTTCELDKELVKKYHDDLYNLREDLKIYLTAFEYRINNIKNTWEIYVNKNIENEKLKHQVQINLMVKETLTNLSSILLELHNIINIVKGAKTEAPESTIKSLYYALTAIDGALSTVNIAMKYATDPGQSLISVSAGEKWANIYTVLKGGIDICFEGIEAYKSSGLTKAQKVNKFRNLLAIVGQVLVMYANYENNQMKEMIKEMDKDLEINELFQSTTYKKLIKERRQWDSLENVYENVCLTYGTVFPLHLRLKGKQERFARDTMSINQNKYGKGIAYYAVKINELNTQLNSYTSSISCEAKSYAFHVFDGNSKRYKPYIIIKKSGSDRIIYEGITHTYIDDRKVTLAPGFYDIHINPGSPIDNFMIRIAEYDFKHYQITGNEDSIINLFPFGRMVVKVETTDGRKQGFSYTVKDKETGERITGAVASEYVTLDLPMNKPLKAEFQIGLAKKMDAHVRISPNRVDTIKLLYDPNKYNFIESNVPNLSGIWESHEYNCDGRMFTCKVRIHHYGNYLRALKIDDGGDHCVPAPNTTFIGNVYHKKGSLNLTIGHIESENLSSMPQNYVILSENKFTLGSMTFTRVHE